MAKKAKSANKSLEIRNYKAENPAASPKEIAEALAGLKVSAQFVSTVLSNAKKKEGKAPGKRGRKPNQLTGHVRGNGFADVMPIFKAASELLKAAGSKDAARVATTWLPRCSTKKPLSS